MHALTTDTVEITGGFWSKKLKLIREVSMQNVYKRFSDTGRFDAFGLNWQEVITRTQQTAIIKQRIARNNVLLVFFITVLLFLIPIFCYCLF
jgi:hypothetical protein